MDKHDAIFIANMKEAFAARSGIRQRLVSSGAISEARLNAIERNVQQHDLTLNEASAIFNSLADICQWQSSVDFNRFCNETLLPDYLKILAFSSTNLK